MLKIAYVSRIMAFHKNKKDYSIFLFKSKNILLSNDRCTVDGINIYHYDNITNIFSDKWFLKLEGRDMLAGNCNPIDIMIYFNSEILINSVMQGYSAVFVDNNIISLMNNERDLKMQHKYIGYRIYYNKDGKPSSFAIDTSIRHMNKQTIEINRRKYNIDTLKMIEHKHMEQAIPRW